MKNYIYSILFLSFSSFSYTQTSYKINWEKTYGGSSIDLLNEIQTTSDGGFILGCYSSSIDGDIKSGNKGRNDYWIVKTDSTGNILWEKTYGGSKDERLFDIQTTSDSGYIFGGNTYSSDGDIKSGNKGGVDGSVIKTDSKGNIIWEKTYGGSKNEAISTIQAISDGGYILGGYTSSSDGDIKSGNNGNNDCWVVKTDSIGNIIWEKTYGGSGTEYSNYIQTTSDGGFILLGYSNSSDGDIKSGNKGIFDCWIVKIDSIGNILWEKTYGGSGEDNLKRIIPTSDGGYIFEGYSGSSDGDVKSGNLGGKDCWVVKTDSTGNILWEKTYGGSGNDEFNKIIPTSDGGYIFGGITYSSDGDVKSGNKGNLDYWVVKTDSIGNILWEKTYGGSGDDYLSGIKPALDGRFVLGGYTKSSNGDIKSGNKGNYDVWLLLLEKNEKPTDLSLDNQQINENSPIDTIIGKLSTIDVDVNDTFAYTLVEGDGSSDNSSFKIQDNSLKSNTELDFETKSEYLIRIQSVDKGGLTFSKSFLIRVNDVNEKPTDIILYINDLDSVLNKEKEVCSFSSIDEDKNETFTYSLVSGEGSGDNILFMIIGEKLYTTSEIDISKNTYFFRIQTLDSKGMSFSKYFTLSDKDIEVGLENILMNDIKVYPNPTTDVLKIKSEKSVLPYDIKLYNLNGQLIMTKTIVNENYEINADNLEVGTYILQFLDKNKSFKEIKFNRK